MTAREFVLVALVAGVAGAAAGFAGNIAREPGEAAAPADLGARLDRIESALARAAESQAESREAVAKLNDRITGLQIDVATAREDAAEAASAQTDHAAPGAAPRVGRARRPAADDRAEGAGPGTVWLGGSSAAEPIRFDVTGAGTRILEATRARLGSMSKGMQLRMLPEAERWKKAQEEVGLSDGQVEILKQAAADRDKAVRESMRIETSNTDGNAAFTIRRMDPAKAAAANEEYKRKVGETLDSAQKAAWDEKGYEHAFGGPGGNTVVLTAATIDVEGTAPANGGK